MMAELWKTRARREAAAGGVGAGAARGFPYKGAVRNMNDLSVSLTLGDYRLMMTQAEWERVVEQAGAMLKEMENGR